jgi:hypothetical protein
MKRPPVLMRVHIRGKEKGFGLWLPLFLLIPLGLALVIAFSPLILIAVIVLRRRRKQDRISPQRSRQLNRGVGIARSYLRVLLSPRGIKSVLDVFCSMPGLRVEVRDKNEQVHISVI